MNENINLCEILKEHEFETFYSPIYGDVYIDLLNDCIRIHIKDKCIYLSPNGKFWGFKNGECLLFPSKEQRDWNKWLEEQKLKVPKTWEELKRSNTIYTHYSLNYIVDDKDYFTAIGTNLIEKSALALLKIHQLIEVGYGGNVTNEEWKELDGCSEENICYTIHTSFTANLFEIYPAFFNKDIIAFHTKEQAEEFLLYPENVELLKDYFMI